MAALSLWISIRDLNDTEVYSATGDIQPAAELQQGFLRDTFAVVPEERVLSDPVRTLQAVNLSLAPLLGRRAPAAPPGGS